MSSKLFVPLQNLSRYYIRSSHWTIDIFSTICFSKKEFSIFVYTKNTYKNQLQRETDLRIPLLNIVDRSRLSIKKQQNPSH